MKIKYKLVLIFIMIIITSSLPLSLFILSRQEKDMISLFTRQGEINCRILAQSTLNILLMNGGDIPSSRVDAREMISILKPLRDSGLVYADVILLSSQKRYNGIILADFTGGLNPVQMIYPDRIIPEEEVNGLKSRTGFRERLLPGLNDLYYEFAAEGALKGKQPFCIGRLIFSKEIVLAPVKRLRRMIYGASGLAVFIVSILGLFISRFISKPIEDLTSGVKQIETGDLDYQIPVKGRDEIGKLTTTFNHMLKLLYLQITELVASNKELRRIDSLKDEFLANVSHELRSPLTGMIGLAESLIDGAAGSIGEEAAHDLSLIVISGRRLSELVSNILDFSKLKHSDVKLKNAPVNMFSITQLVISIMKTMAGVKSLNIYNKIDMDTAWVNGDKNFLQQIMINLLGNAIKFTEQGEITIDAGWHPENNNQLIVSVTDTGVGIPKDKIETVFETFEQADGSASRVFGGVGLGLAITRNLVELHNGEIWVESEVDKGSRFSFNLEKCDRPSRPSGKEDAEVFDEYIVPSVDDVRLIDDLGFDQGSAKRVLIVDDEPVVVQVLINHLSLEGYQVKMAASASEALEILDESELLDLILLDVMLPRMSGYELCRIIRARYSQYELPVLMLTAKNKPEDIVTGIECGANDYITKPVSRQELLARVKNLISLKNSLREHDELNIIKRDLQVAHEIQQALLSKDLPLNENYGIALRYKPMYELGGDFYDIRLIDGNKLCILMADVSGHGIPAALICAMLKVSYSFYKEYALDPAQFFNRINSIMFEHCYGQFITACYAYIDLDAGRLYKSNAGHWPILVWSREEQVFKMKRDKSIPFGWLSDETFVSSAVDIKQGDRILMYTDGILEAFNEKKEMYGEARFHNLIRENQHLSADDLADIVLDEITDWSGIARNESFADDVTLIVIDIIRMETGES